MARAKRSTSPIPKAPAPILVLEEVNGVMHALACLAGFHTWTPLDARIHGEASGCAWCGEVKVVSRDPLPSSGAGSDPSVRPAA